MLFVQISFWSLLAGLGRLLRSGPYLLILLSYSFLIGLSIDSGALLTDNLGPLTSNSQAVAGWCASGLLAAESNDDAEIRNPRLSHKHSKFAGTIIRFQQKPKICNI